MTLYTHFWTLIFCHVSRPFYDEFTSLPMGHHNNQGFKIIIIMLVNVKWYRSNNYPSLSLFEMIFNGDLKQYDIWIYMHIPV